LLEPLFAQQKVLRNQLAQQQLRVNEVKMQISAIQQESSPNSTSPQRTRINQLKQQLDEGDIFLKSSREKLVQPEKMAEHLRQILSRNSRLQLVSLNTLPATPLLEQAAEKNADKPKVSQVAGAEAGMDKQVFKHGVQLTLRGNYLDLLQYLSALEKLPQQMYWTQAHMNVVQYPSTELTLTVYTLSLDKTWLQI